MKLLRLSILLLLININGYSQLDWWASSSDLDTVHVFLGRGQSNYLGHGKIENTSAGLTYYFYDNDSILINNYLVDELQNLTYNNSRLEPASSYDFGLNLSFAYEAYQYYKDPIVFLSYGKSGTGLFYQSGVKDWNVLSTNEYYDTSIYYANNGIDLIRLKYPNSIIKIEAAIWVQGEYDADNDIDSTTYRNDIDSLLLYTRRDLGNNEIIHLVGRTHYAGTAYTDAQADPIRAAQMAHCDADSFAYWTNLDTLSLEVDLLHFNSDAVMYLGQMLWDSFINKTNNLAE